MKRTLISPDLEAFPDIYRKLLEGSKIYDSSCSPEARVYYIDKDDGYYLKSAPSGTLKKEAEMTAYFYQKGLSAEILNYLSTDRDWLLSKRVIGEDCTYFAYREDPKRLSETIAVLLRELHEQDYSDCPCQNRISSYLETARINRSKGNFDTELFTEQWRFSSEKAAWDYLEENKHFLKNDTLIHGDYCLPNIMLNNWKFSGFIDVGNGGVGDRHIDLFWGMWTLWFNLKTTVYTDRFFDAYGRDKLIPDVLRIISAAEVFG